jgi:hypothetical protein
MAPQENEVPLLERLEDFAGKLEGGELEIGEFNTWFMNSQWEARMANNSSALRLGWDIQNILFEWQDYPDVIPPWRLASNIREAMELNGFPRRPMATRSSGPV